MPAWPRYDASRDELMDFDVTTTVRQVPDRAVLTLLEKRIRSVGASLHFCAYADEVARARRCGSSK